VIQLHIRHTNGNRHCLETNPGRNFGLEKSLSEATGPEGWQVEMRTHHRFFTGCSGGRETRLLRYHEGLANQGETHMVS